MWEWKLHPLARSCFPSGNWAIGPEREREKGRWGETVRHNNFTPTLSPMQGRQIGFFFCKGAWSWLFVSLPRWCAAIYWTSDDKYPTCQSEAWQLMSLTQRGLIRSLSAKLRARIYSPLLLPYQCILVDINEKQVSFWHCPNYQFNIVCSFQLREGFK